MNDQKNIVLCLEELIGAWNGDAGAIVSCVSAEPELWFSCFGKSFTREALVNWFRQDGLNCSVQLCNHAECIGQDKAYQYASVTGLYETNELYPRHLAFGGCFANEMAKEDGEWKYKKIRFDLQCEDSVKFTYLTKEGLLYKEPGYGTHAILPGWKWIDDRIGHNMSYVPGTAVPVINAEYDLPWYACIQRKNKGTDQEKVKELLVRLSAAYDCASLFLAKDLFASNAVMYMDQTAFTGARDIMDFLKMARKTTSRSFHAYTFTNISESGNTMKVQAERISPDRRSQKYITDPEKEWISGKILYTAEKDRDAWKITEMTIQEEGR